MRGQIVTWFEHACIAAAVPVFAVLVTGWYYAGLTAALATFGVFYAREIRDERAHRRAGTWDRPEPGTGITPAVDRWADMVGPWTVLLTWTMLELLRLVWSLTGVL